MDALGANLDFGQEEADNKYIQGPSFLLLQKKGALRACDCYCALRMKKMNI